MSRRVAMVALLLLGLPWLGAEAATSKPAKPVDVFKHPVSANKPSKAFAKVTARLTKAKVLRARFVQTKKLKALRFPLKSKGRFLYSRSSGIYWKIATPFPATFVITSAGIVQKAEGKTTRITGKKQPIIFGFTRMFLAIFSGKAKALHRHFRVYFHQGPNSWSLGLLPRHPVLKRIFARITLQGNKDIERVQLEERSGDHTSIQFSKLKRGQALTTREKKYFR